MITLDVTWGPFFLYFGMALLLILGILAAIVVLIVFMVKNDRKKKALALAASVEPAAGNEKPEN